MEGRTGRILPGTFRISRPGEPSATSNLPDTTPESPTLFALLRKMVNEGITDVVMEVSSHALAQARLTGIGFDIGVFTNLTRDHLDFHADMQNYFSSKKRLFTDYLKPGGRIVIVLDGSFADRKSDKPLSTNNNSWSAQMLADLTHLFQAQKTSPAIICCGMDSNCDIHPRNFITDINGITSDIKTPAGSLSLKTPLVGEFNLRNMLCAIGIGLAHNEKLQCINAGLQNVKTIPGRLERIIMQTTEPPGPAVFVDYAHTPDALESVLNALLKLKRKRLICVFGCGGDRDSGKRVLMGEIAGRLCDVVLATSDNPRTESPEVILAQIEQGLASTGLGKTPLNMLSRDDGKGYAIIVKRRRAIRTAIRLAKPEDVILISGKGHENYQISRKGRIFFDDRIEAEMQLQAKCGAPFFWKLEWVQQITGARLLAPVTTNVTFNNISTDTRSITPGDLFVALKGENFDGATFAQRAVEKGGAGLLVNCTPDGKEPPVAFQPSVPILLVPDTLAALGRLASALRCWYSHLRVVAITGSSGKTTVKEMTSAILGQSHTILKTEGNFNNLIGLPLTLLRLKPEHEIAVLEMGMNRPGEIARLTEIADPDVACIVNVQEAHLEGLGDILGVARAKNELFTGLKPEARILVNLDDEIVSSLAEKLSQEKITFGCHQNAFIRASAIQSLAEEGMEYTIHVGADTRRVVISSLGRHNVTNSLAAAAMAYGCGSSIDEITRGLEAFRPYDKRARVEKLPSGIKVLNDCYNANPASMAAAFKTMLDVKQGRQAVAVLGDMLELGAQSDTAHAALGKAVQEHGFDFLAAYGSKAEIIVASAINAGMAPVAAQKFNSKPELASWLHKLLQDGKIKAGDWFLIKGSRGMRMEEVIELLREKTSSLKAAGN